MTSAPTDGARELVGRELANFESITRSIKPGPGDEPTLDGFGIHGLSLPVRGVGGGDHLIYIDFEQRYDLAARIELALERGQDDVAERLERCRAKAGVALIDVSGHRVTDAMLAAMFHQAFLLGAIYELDQFGEITAHLFENLNTRFYNSSSVNKYLTMLYAEISEDARFRFLSAAHPAPLVFSSLNDRFMEVRDEYRETSSPLGTMPSRHVIDRSTTNSVLGFKGHYQWNEWIVMGRGDVLILATDGLLELGGEEPDLPRLEDVVRRNKHQSTETIAHAIEADVLSRGEPDDDVTFVVIKRL